MRRIHVRKRIRLKRVGFMGVHKQGITFINNFFANQAKPLPS